ncbi:MULTISPECIES: HTTM domain-containing protein [Streptomyces]|uniref:HTTM domain-containing protein n=1 Tax=Streptomyces TaxID=1883 RepID=UPI0006AF4F84|nr:MULTISPECIES: HTTM domain-containing protein [unclassified Streptomyces]KOU80145.1 deoxyribonuclease HsdR [Streptomyces sp. XY58]KOV06453.1 deoxyribonuclease HsdR [Streptomyces sp. XY37]KOV45996.1 deoxyribonuclease HsdR [Streptomyces sp. H021]KOV49561.1 deoxyribonuclease HsdR [Streptomyces sp. MMG1064]
MGSEQIPRPPSTAAAQHLPATQEASVAGRAHRWLLDRTGALWALLTDRPVSLYAASVLRIGYGLLYLVFLLREFPHRDEIWGPGSPWTPALAQQLFDQTGWNSMLLLSDSRAYFEFCYVMALFTSALFMLGWRTRVMSVLFAVVVASFHARSIFMTDGGDNLILLMALYLVLTACGRRWSLDARRNRLKADRAGDAPEPVRSLFAQQLRDARDTLTTVVHNCGILVIAAQVCFLYGSAGLYKIQGPTWGGGTALHYALNLELFQPWPALSHLVDDYPMVIAIASYVTVLLQVAFPFVLFGKLKYPVLTVLLGMHIGIAVLLGLPLFSGAMIVADAVFLPDRFYSFLPRPWRRATRRTAVWRPEPGRAAGSTSVPPQGRPSEPASKHRVTSAGQLNTAPATVEVADAGKGFS